MTEEEKKDKGSGFDYDEIVMEAWPEFMEEQQKKDDEFFKKNDPKFYEMMMRHRKKHASD